MYAHAPHGWAAVCWYVVMSHGVEDVLMDSRFCFGVTAPTIVSSFFFTGNFTLYRRMFRKRVAQDIPLDAQSAQNDPAVAAGESGATV